MSNSPMIWKVFTFFLLAASQLVCCNERPDPVPASLTYQRLREMLLTPDGKNVDFEAVEEVIMTIYKLQKDEARYTSEQSDERERYTPPLESDDEEEPQPLLKKYLMAGIRPSTTNLLEVSVACDLCASFLHITGTILSSKLVWPTTVSMSKKICVKLIGYSDLACEGMIDALQGIVFYAAPNMRKSPYTICGFFLKGCGAPDYTQPLWEIALPPPLPAPVAPQLGQETAKENITIFFMTDLHIDFQYKEGSPANCKEPLCCRPSSTPKNDPVPDDEKAGYWGDYRMCDMPIYGFEDMLRYVNKTQGDDIDFIVMAGDVTPHDLWGLSQEDDINAFKEVTKRLDDFFPGKPYFLTFGNHDAHPVNSYPLPGDLGQFPMDWLYEGLAPIFMKYLPATAEKTLKTAGFYTTVLREGLRLIVLNDNYCYIQNFFNYAGSNLTDPFGQLGWMVGLLTEAEKSGERVIILAHVQPGDNDCLPAYSYNYHRIIDRFYKVIAGQFFGHVHKDYFVLYHDVQTLTKPISVSFVGPPTTFFPLNNPGFRMYDFDPKTNTLKNYRQYYADIKVANAIGDKEKMPWQLQYSAVGEYLLPDMSAESWADFAKRMRTDTDLHQKYQDNWSSKLNNVTEAKCVFECETDGLCTIYQSLARVPSSFCRHFLYGPEPPEDDDSKRKCSKRFLKWADTV